MEICFSEQNSMTTSSFHLGNKWQIKNTFLSLFSDQNHDNTELDNLLNDLILSYPEHFGGSCDLYEFTITQDQVGGFERLQMSTRYIYEYDKTTYCRSFNDITVPFFIKNIARFAIISNTCYELFDDVSDEYGSIEFLKRIACPEDGCNYGIDASNIFNLYKHIYPYRNISISEIGNVSDWGIQANTSVNESIQVLGLAFCLDQNWTMF